MNDQTNTGATTTPDTTSRADLHCHSAASQLSKLGVQRALGLPECATPPEEVYALAKRRGMDFVTITDHDTIAGVLEIADRPDVFVSEELTAWFRGEPRAVHVLCYGIDAGDHEWLQAHASDVERCAAYLREREIACALAHPFYAVEQPLRPQHRRRLAELFEVWETRNGARARELNQPAAVYVETHGGTGVGGSDDHAGVDIGRTWTEVPLAASVGGLLGHLRAGLAQPGGEQGSAAKWAHAAMGLAARVLARDGVGEPDPRAVLRMVERMVSEGDARRTALGRGLRPQDARDLLAAWLSGMELDLPANELLALLQDESFSHAALERRARRTHERALRGAVARAVTAEPSTAAIGAAAHELFAACVPAVPYVPAALFLAREKAKLAAREHEPRRVALIADGVSAMHGVTRTVEELRERGLDGFELEVIGTDAHVDRRLPSVAEASIPFYPDLRLGVPGLPALTDALADGRYDLVHVLAPGPAGAAAALLGRVAGLPVVGSYHTELAAYAELRSGDARVKTAMAAGLAAFYGACRRVLSPSPAADASLRAVGVAPELIRRWERGVELACFDPARRVESLLPGEINVLYAGRLTAEKGAALLADAFLAARRRDPRLHLVLAGGGAEEEALRERLAPHATFLGWLERDELARVYASADLFLFASATDTFGQVVLEAQASGLPVVAVAQGGPLALIRDGVSGRLCAPDADALAGALLQIAASPSLRSRLVAGGRAAAEQRTWERSLTQLADGYRDALQQPAGDERRRAA
jgi:glycosyltransferase involved in cell wall biosynthesis/predicted metal-dependent phosphoesterase TrpH